MTVYNKMIKPLLPEIQEFMQLTKYGMRTVLTIGSQSKVVRLNLKNLLILTSFTHYQSLEKIVVHVDQVLVSHVRSLIL